jgi:cyclopropane-fatty-acyl-phospholipid synthase
MIQTSLKLKTQEILEKAGVRIDGSQPWDIVIHNQRFYSHIFTRGALGLGESYMNNWWECKRLDQLFYRILSSGVDSNFRLDFYSLIDSFWSAVVNLQKKSRAFNVGKAHYDRDYDLYKAMLDDRMVYTCAYWPQAGDLNKAQENKLDLVCQKMGLKPGQAILDIGCGWGGFARFAAEKYGVHVTGITVSREQVRIGSKLCEGLPVKILYQDYRDVEGRFDHIVSLGMFEHVGYKNYGTFMKTVREHLKDDGLFLLHTIGSNYSVRTTNAWTKKYIFPNSMLPSILQIGKAIEKVFVMEDWHNFGADYDRTLMAWFWNFKTKWPELNKNYSERFYRMWKYYLLSSAGAFRSRQLQLWQIVLSPNGVFGGYEPSRYCNERSKYVKQMVIGK